MYLKIKELIKDVRPLVEYASCVWSPSSVGLIRKIEAFQKRFTKRLPDFNVLDYHDRLVLLGLESLELRRLNADLCMTYKIMFNLVDLTVDNLIFILVFLSFIKVIFFNSVHLHKITFTRTCTVHSLTCTRF